MGGWLDENAATSKGLWLKIAKKGLSIQSVSYPEALCQGWIDGQKASFDERLWLQRFIPRKPRSSWSKVNRQKVTELVQRGKMKPRGLEEVERAKRDGRWDAAYDAQSAATVPDDLRRRLDDNPQASAFFATLDSRNRYAILHRIQEAKKPETRVRRSRNTSPCSASTRSCTSRRNLRRQGLSAPAHHQYRTSIT